MEWLGECAVLPCPSFPLDLDGDGSTEEIVLFQDHAVAFARGAEGGWRPFAETRVDQRDVASELSIERARPSARPLRAWELQIGNGRRLLVEESSR